jgi:hypothetical protein
MLSEAVVWLRSPSGWIGVGDAIRGVALTAQEVA